MLLKKKNIRKIKTEMPSVTKKPTKSPKAAKPAAKKVAKPVKSPKAKPAKSPKAKPAKSPKAAKVTKPAKSPKAAKVAKPAKSPKAAKPAAKKVAKTTTHSSPKHTGAVAAHHTSPHPTSHKKEKRTRRTSSKPRKPNAFMNYMAKHRESIVKNLPHGHSPQDVTKKASVMYNAMSQAEKDSYKK